MRADIHDGPERSTLRSEAGYIDARPHLTGCQNLLQRAAGPYIRVRSDKTPTEHNRSANPHLAELTADLLRLRLRAKKRPRTRGSTVSVSRRSKCSATWLTGADCDKRKLLKIAGGCTIICLLDGASLRSPREDAGGIRQQRSARPRLTSRRLGFRLVQIQGLNVTLRLRTPAAASAASTW